MIPMEPRRPGCSVVEGKDITEPKVKALAKAADDCWAAILNKDLKAFAEAYQASFEAQVAMFPGMVRPAESLELKVESLESVESLEGRVESLESVEKVERGKSVIEYIKEYSALPGVLAYKMPGAGGGGYLACVVEDAEAFCKEHAEAIALTIRRAGF